MKSEYVYTKKNASSQGGWGTHPLHPPPRSAPAILDSVTYVVYGMGKLPIVNELRK